MQALENGMTLRILFEQLAGCREELNLPIILMGYINPVLQFGVEAFCQKCQGGGVDGVILPICRLICIRPSTKPFRSVWHSYVFLITPQTSDERIRLIDEASEGFIYMVSSASITGSVTGISDIMATYLNGLLP
jgi:tryptophan synthase alpha chain